MPDKYQSPYTFSTHIGAAAREAWSYGLANLRLHPIMSLACGGDGDGIITGRETEAAVEALRRCEERSLAGQFALEVMHEVRNPLDAIGNLVYLALAAQDLPQAKEYISAATEHIVALHQIAVQSLTLTRNSQTARPVDLVALSEAALRVHHRRVMAKQIQLKRDVCEEAVVTVRMGEILQVLSNLIGNALDALPEGGTISLLI